MDIIFVLIEWCSPSAGLLAHLAIVESMWNDYAQLFLCCIDNIVDLDQLYECGHAFAPTSCVLFYLVMFILQLLGEGTGIWSKKETLNAFTLSSLDGYLSRLLKSTV